MEPLLTENLYDLANWETFRPSHKGFLPPADLDIFSVQALIDRLSEGRLRAGNAVVASSVDLKSSLNPGIEINSELINFPLGSRDQQFLNSQNVPLMTYPSTSVGITNTAWSAFVEDCSNKALGSMHAKNGTKTLALAEFAMQAGGHDRCIQHKVPASVNGRHIATLIVVLPSRASEFSLTAKYPGRDAEVMFEDFDTFSSEAVAVYTGLEEVVLKVGNGLLSYLVFSILSTNLADGLGNLSAAVPGIRDAFRHWSHLLSINSSRAPNAVIPYAFGMNQTHPTLDTAVSDDDRDALILAHLAPPAKAYGFKMYLGELHRHSSCEIRVDHEYKEYYDWYDELKADEMEMRKPIDVELYWEFMNLDSSDASSALTEDDLDEQLIARASHQIRKCKATADLECVDDSCYEGTVRLTQERTRTFLIITPD